MEMTHFRLVCMCIYIYIYAYSSHLLHTTQDPCPKCKGPIDHTLYVDASEYERAAKKAKADWIRQKTEAANKTIAETGDRTCDHRFKFGRCYKCGFSEAIYRREIVVERLEAKKHPKKKIVLLAPEGGVSLECVQCGYLWQRPEGERMDKPCPKCLTPVDGECQRERVCVCGFEHET
jgi:hypothetical protein